VKIFKIRWLSYWSRNDNPPTEFLVRKRIRGDSAHEVGNSLNDFADVKSGEIFHRYKLAEDFIATTTLAPAPVAPTE
jgi:hypothetical protein